MNEIIMSSFGTSSRGEEVNKYTLTNKNGMSVSLIEYGACIQSVIVPDRKGDPVDVVLGYDTVEDYEKGDSYLGAFVGRYANRIGGSAFELNEKRYLLPANEGRNHLHGVLSHRVHLSDIEDNAVVFHGVSPDGDEGFPGTLFFNVTYSLDDDNRLTIAYQAVTDKDTVINFTNHAYFNLNGQDGSTILEHELCLKAAHFTECDEELIPTGRLIPVEGTPMDFRTSKQIGQDILSDYIPIALCKGYDHNFVLESSDLSTPFAQLVSEKSGIRMRCYTDQPGVQIYTGNGLNVQQGKGGMSYPNYGAICLETQHYPDSPNHPEFPTTILKAGQMYETTTVYKFDVVN